MEFENGDNYAVDGRWGMGGGGCAVGAGRLASPTDGEGGLTVWRDVNEVGILKSIHQKYLRSLTQRLAVEFENGDN